MQFHFPNFSRGLKCLNCGAPLTIFSTAQLTLYLNNETFVCDHCGAPIKIFETLNSCIEENFFLNDIFVFADAKNSIFTTQLNPKSTTTLLFEEYGIPKGSRILHINYTAEGNSLYPLENHGNTPFRGSPKDSVVIYPARFGLNEPTTTTLNVLVTWIERGSLEDVSLKSLVDAFQEYSNQDFETCIVPANTAIEFDIMQYAETALHEISSKTNVKEFFNSGVSYVPSLKIIMPLLAKTKNFPPLPEELLASLLMLAKLRNQIAHTGKTKEPLSKQIASTCLTGVILGKWYLRELRRS
jgi:hypothetical protein